MFVSGTLFNSETVTCARCVHMPKQGSRQFNTFIDSITSYSTYFVVAQSHRVTFLDEQFTLVGEFEVDEVIVRLEFIETKNHKDVQLAIITLDNRIYLTRVSIANKHDFVEGQLKVDVEVLHQYNLSEDVKSNQNDTLIINYGFYLVVEFATHFYILHEGQQLQFTKQPGWSVVRVPHALVEENTKRPSILLKNGNESNRFTIKRQESNQYDHVLLVLNFSMKRSQVFLYGSTTTQRSLEQDDLIKQVDLGVGVKEMFLMSKERPLYLMQSQLDNCAKIMDLHLSSIVCNIELDHDLLNVFPFEAGCEGIITLHGVKEPMKYVLSEHMELELCRFGMGMILSDAVGQNQSLVLASQMGDSYLIHENTIVKTFRNIGPVTNLQEMKDHQRSLYLTTMKEGDQVHQYRKGIQIKKVHARHRFNIERQKPKKMFLIGRQYMLLSFTQSSILYEIEHKTIKQLTCNLIEQEKTLLFTALPHMMLQVTPKAIVLLNSDLSYHSTQFLDHVLVDVFITGTYTLLSRCVNNGLRTINLAGGQIRVGEATHLDVVPGVIIYSQLLRCLVYSVAGCPGECMVGDLRKQLPCDSEHESICTLLQHGTELHIGTNFGAISTFDAVSLELLRVIKISYKHPIMLHVYRETVICVSKQLHMISHGKLVDINWDNLIQAQPFDDLLVGLLRTGELQIAELEDAESRHCTPIFHCTETIAFVFRSPGLYVTVSETHVKAYNYSFKLVQQVNHTMTLINAVIAGCELFICGYSHHLQTTKGQLMHIRIYEEKFTTTLKQAKQPIKDIIVHGGCIWMMTSTKLKCYSEITENSRPIFSHNYGIQLRGFDISSQYLLMYDDIKGVWIYRYDLALRKQVAWGQHYKPVSKAHFFGDQSSPQILCFQQDGCVTVCTIDQALLGLKDKMVSKTILQSEPVCSSTGRKDHIIYGTIYGSVRFILNLHLANPLQLSERVSLSQSTRSSLSVDYDTLVKAHRTPSIQAQIDQIDRIIS